LGLFSGMTSQGSTALNNAISTSAMLGSDASGISSSLTPFLTQEMLHPTGYGQQGLSAMTAAAEGGAGGATSGLTGQAMQRAAASHNTGSYQAALDAASRNRAQASANASEGIAAKNAELQQQQQQEGAAGLGSMYKTDTSGMLDAMGQEANDIKVGQTGGILGDLSGIAGLGLNIGKLAGGFGIPGFQGFAPGGR
jgi:hypothetical protein